MGEDSGTSVPALSGVAGESNMLLFCLRRRAIDISITVLLY